MTWSIAATLSATETRDAIREVVDNHLPGLGFDIATPSANTSNRNMRLDISAKNVFSATHIYIFFSNTYTKLSGLYNSNGAATWQEHNYTGSGAFTIGSVTGETIRLWTSSASPRSFMLLTSTGKNIWTFMDFDTYMSQGDSTFNTAANGDTLVGTPIGYANSGTGLSGYAGHPTNTTNNVSTVNSMDPDLGSTSAGTNADPNVAGTVIQGFRMMALASTGPTGDKEMAVGVVSNSDFLLHMGSGSGKLFCDGNTLQKVTDGTNWYFRTSSDLTATALLLPVGTSEPTF